MGTINSIGFTGTQRGLTTIQASMLWQTLTKLHEYDIYEYHHGTCIGADDQFDAFVRLIDNPGSTIHIHPPNNAQKTADCHLRPIGLRQVHIHSQKGYLDRNTDIVTCSHIIVACPGECHEVIRSGTWATIRRARRMKKPHVLVFPDGSLEFSWQNSNNDV